MRLPRRHTTRVPVRVQRFAFTMVELLVVMAIIALLVAILMPSLSKAKEAGRRARCASNLRQWGLMVHNYGVDNKSNTPGVVWWGNIDTFGLNIDPDGGGPLPAVQGSTLEIPKYGIRQGVTQCPSRTSKRNTPTGIVANGAEMDYWILRPRRLPDRRGTVGHGAPLGAARHQPRQEAVAQHTAHDGPSLLAAGRDALGSS